MSLQSTVLFDLPQSEIASLIVDRIAQSSETSIVTGFATPGGLAAIAAPIKTQPLILKTLVIGAATYPGFEALDDLLSDGVPPDRLHVHLGHTFATGGRKNPFARYHPMLHSKIYYMELPGSEACAFIGSNNLTSFALTGLNGEAAVLLEGPRNSPEFEKVRAHIEAAQNQAVKYSPGMKEAFAWWWREYIDGMRAEVGLPQDWTTVRTILVFVRATKGDRPAVGDQIYFEIPAGIEQIESLRTETHLFLFDALPATPWEAISRAVTADSSFKCLTLGAENKQGNREVDANWRVDMTPSPLLVAVPRGVLRPSAPKGMQQVRAEVQSESVSPFEYFFDRDRAEWEPNFSDSPPLYSSRAPSQVVDVGETTDFAVVQRVGKSSLERGHSERRSRDGWKLVNGLARRLRSGKESDEAALRLAAPESGSFLLVSLRRRRKDRVRTDEKEG